MQPSRRNCLWASLGLFAFLALASRARAETLTITSTPPGATVEIDGVVIGTTPCEVKYPGGYFHKTRTVFGQRLEHSMIVRIYKDGFTSQEVRLTDGPFEWVAVTGRHRGNYFLLKKNEFHIDLQRGTYSTASSIDTNEHAGPLRPASAAAFRADDGTLGPSLGTVKIESEPPGAEIYVDYSFVGQTPSTLHLASGSHRIELKSPGKTEWQRNLDVTKDSQITLHPVLEASP
jgi:PEGA domain